MDEKTLMKYKVDQLRAYLSVHHPDFSTAKVKKAGLVSAILARRETSGIRAAFPPKIPDAVPRVRATQPVEIKGQPIRVTLSASSEQNIADRVEEKIETKPPIKDETPLKGKSLASETAGMNKQEKEFYLFEKEIKNVSDDQLKELKKKLSKESGDVFKIIEKIPEKVPAALTKQYKQILSKERAISREFARRKHQGTK
jgi:hypothetical protein